MITITFSISVWIFGFEILLNSLIISMHLTHTQRWLYTLFSILTFREIFFDNLNFTSTKFVEFTYLEKTNRIVMLGPNN